MHRLCTKSFLSLWSYDNPQQRRGKELCDVLVVCDPDVVLISVKEVALKDPDTEVNVERWRRATIRNSVKQLYGADRALSRLTHVIRRDGTEGLPFPSPHRRVHRVAVALGAKRQMPFEQGDFGKGYVHVFDELALDRVLGELDTVTDFVRYLEAKESLGIASRQLITVGEEDLLAIYLHNGRRFPVVDALVVDANVWDQLVAKPEWQRRKAEDLQSYVWDALIEDFAENTGVPGSVGAQSLVDREGVLRILAREDRFSRRVLASALNEFMMAAANNVTAARMVGSLSGIVYVFLAVPGGVDRESRRAVLTLRCFVARGLNPQAETVVGLATERRGTATQFSWNALQLTIPQWTPEHQARMVAMQSELGYFTNPVYLKTSHDEYPAT